MTFGEKILTLAKSRWKLLKLLALFFNQYFFDINVLPGNKSIRMSLNHLKSMREIEKSWLRKMESVETSNSVFVFTFNLIMPRFWKRKVCKICLFQGADYWKMQTLIHGDDCYQLMNFYPIDLGRIRKSIPDDPPK